MSLVIQGVTIPSEAIIASGLTKAQRLKLGVEKNIKTIDTWCQDTNGFGPKAQQLLHRLVAQHKTSDGLDWTKIAEWLGLTCDPSNPRYNGFVKCNTAMNIKRVDTKNINVWMDDEVYLNSEGLGYAFMAYVKKQADRKAGITTRFERTHLVITKR